MIVLRLKKHLKANYFPVDRIDFYDEAHIEDKKKREVETWIRDNVKGRVYATEGKFWFETDEGRCHFLLRWGRHN